MANVVGVVNDIFDILSDSSIKKSELVGTMVDILIALDDNAVLDGFETELEDCYNINGSLDEALNEFYSLGNDSEDDDEDDED